MRRSYTKEQAEAAAAQAGAVHDPRFNGLRQSVVPRRYTCANIWKDGTVLDLLEAGMGSVVGYSDFSSITGQIFFTEIMDRYQAEEFVFSKAIEHKQSSIQDIEKIAGISNLSDGLL